MALNLYLLRHGQTELSREDTFCGAGLNPELTVDGLEMAQAFANAYGKTRWQAIFTSALKRTLSTAEPLSNLVGIKSQPRPELNEIAYGRCSLTRRGTLRQAANQPSRLQVAL